MEGTLQLLYVLLTDCYVYLLRKGACRPCPRAPHTPRAPPAPHVGMQVHPTAALLPSRGLLSRSPRRPFRSPAPGSAGHRGQAPENGSGGRETWPPWGISVGVSSLRGHREAVPGGRGCLLQRTGLRVGESGLLGRPPTAAEHPPQPSGLGAAPHHRELLYVAWGGESQAGRRLCLFTRRVCDRPSPPHARVPGLWSLTSWQPQGVLPPSPADLRVATAAASARQRPSPVRVRAVVSGRWAWTSRR